MNNNYNGICCSYLVPNRYIHPDDKLGWNGYEWRVLRIYHDGYQKHLVAAIIIDGDDPCNNDEPIYINPSHCPLSDAYVKDVFLYYGNYRNGIKITFNRIDGLW